MKMLFTTLIVLSFSAPLTADEISLSGEEIETLISGKTINGVHFGKKTIQYFSESGLTLWIGQGDELPSEGKWKVDNNQYCSNFGSDWSCFNIAHDKAQNIHYFVNEGFRAPFVVASSFSLEF